MQLTFRTENPADYAAVENLVRDAFWNVYVPGCEEHLLVHRLRHSPYAIPTLNLLAFADGQLAAHILYTESEIVPTIGDAYKTLTFAPLSVHPRFQGQGIGTALTEHSLQLAQQMGCQAVAIYGYIDYYSRFGFRHAKEFGVSDSEGKYPYGMLLLPMGPDSIPCGKLHLKADFSVDPQALEDFDSTFPPKDKKETASQKIFAEAVSRYL